ncbi:MAG: PLP-dependent transferase [Thiotrichaceae bacterium]
MGLRCDWRIIVTPNSFCKLIDVKTKAIFCRSIGNPLGNVVDFGELAQLAHAHGIPLDW